jgi:hypothetical protein
MVYLVQRVGNTGMDGVFSSLDEVVNAFPGVTLVPVQPNEVVTNRVGSSEDCVVFHDDVSDMYKFMTPDEHDTDSWYVVEGYELNRLY